MPDLVKQLTIIINEEDAEHTASFEVPQALLIEHSDYFRAACQNEWKEATSRVIKLADVNADAFNNYLYWVHEKKVSVNRPLGVLCEGNIPNFVPWVNNMANLWLLSDRLADERLRNEVLDILADRIESIHLVLGAIPAGMINKIWSTTTPGRALRRLIVEYYAQSVTASEILPSINELDWSFKQEVMLRMMEEKEDDDRKCFSLSFGPCYWHEHDKQHPQYHQRPGVLEADAT